jgi:hypothetical protein
MDNGIGHNVSRADGASASGTHQRKQEQLSVVTTGLCTTPSKAQASAHDVCLRHQASHLIASTTARFPWSKQIM